MTKILDVGCGDNKFDGSIGLDYNPRTGADVIHGEDESRTKQDEDDDHQAGVFAHVFNHDEKISIGLLARRSAAGAGT